ncbi:methyltransferase family protein [Methylomonas lenta]|uniref:methyltransferase family protein n=1 Tax=Methylomonas lenta TaxID=980561 RepID=UPI000ABDDF66|nr:methyltransferase [Methylomonas lenta]
MRYLLAFKVILFTVLVPGTVIFYFPYSLVLRSTGSLQWPNLALSIPASLCILIGTAIYLRCAWDFAVDGLGTPAPIDPPKKLVVSGLYRRTRNPMYHGVLLLLLAECLLFPEAGLWIYASSIGLTFHLFVVFYEEPALVKRFGVTYSDYCQKVPRWGFASQPFSSNAAGKD